MRWFTDEEKDTLGKAMIYAPIKQILKLVLWDFFYPSKRDKLLKHLQNGMSWHSAYNEIINLKIKKHENIYN